MDFIEAREIRTRLSLWTAIERGRIFIVRPQQTFVLCGQRLLAKRPSYVVSMAYVSRATTPLGVGLVAKSLPWRRVLGAARLIAGTTGLVMPRFEGLRWRSSTSSLSRVPRIPFQGNGLSLRSRPWLLLLLLLVCGHWARRSLAPRRDPCRRGPNGGVVAVQQPLPQLLPPPHLAHGFRTVPELR